MRKYRAEVLSLNEVRHYYADTVDEAAELAAEEFGEEDIGRVHELR